MGSDRKHHAEYGACFVVDQYGLPGVLGQIYGLTKKGFIFIIDEWDCVFRFAKERKEIRRHIWIFSEGFLKEPNMWNWLI